MSGSDPSEQRVVDGTAWRDFCQALERAGQVILEEGSPEDSFERAEGLRYLTRLTRAAFETFIEDCDPGAPEFLRTCNETVKMGADNPDNYYQNAPVSSRFRYRLRGTRGTVHYLGFATMAGNYGASGSMPPTSTIRSWCSTRRAALRSSFQPSVPRARRTGSRWPAIRSRWSSDKRSSTERRRSAHSST